MTYQPPAGARDLLPLDVAQKYWIENRLEQVFQRWGYHRIITSTMEQMDTLMAGGAIDQEAVIELQPVAGKRLGLRPELTASIARTAVTRLARVTYPQRLYYNANVFRQATQGSHGGQQEFYQAGVELLGAGATVADAEIVLLLVDCLHNLSLGSWCLILGDAQLTQALLTPFAPDQRQAVRQALATLDRVALDGMGLSPELHHHALHLLDLRGHPEDVLQALGQLALEPEAQTAVERLKSLVALVRDVINTGGDSQRLTQGSQRPALTLDLSLIQPFDYYTGLVFEVVTGPEQGCQVLGQGGRYDHLLGVFQGQGQGFPGIGFVLNIEALHQTLLPMGYLPQETPPSDWLVVPTAPQAAAAAFTYAQTLRASASLVRAEVHLADGESPATTRDLARQRRISRIAWIGPDGLPDIEALN
ncbi:MULTISPECIES: ATP phosphoribosyltransferase regulatory subunit [Cyanophyceae]|uniref:ATP phosphoribosyltransferase regulatory subunit n=1 Tax=Cyanophyceae TaxID=3028117 RepID=UPI00168708B6|nr:MULTISPECIES: ATP phosphoribosyltransferase regulatory subunit [Cyanophyceae]MBD1916501.1 ATP phosphoribosyltransferase regulatory subunit [Phormidium sp. FACHB-77]MBD2032068.1 ATP phosphoribosyltransferase regulatory subunit [Phormidium sp. FACHB-322]MBD2052948.1 ATP phosphoribosyltransferase regulatory subunit [Leptolyngbya sp. FACHB-60]